MMKITGLSHLFKWENLHNWWLTKYFFAPLYLTHLNPLNYNIVWPKGIQPTCKLQTVNNTVFLYYFLLLPFLIP